MGSLFNEFMLRVRGDDLNESNFDEFVKEIQIKLIQGEISEGEFDLLFSKMKLPDHWRKSFDARCESHSRSPATFALQVSKMTVGAQPVIADFVIKSMSRFFNVNRRDNGMDNSGFLIVNPLKLSAEPDYFFDINETAIKFETKHIKGYNTCIPKVSDLKSAVQKNAITIYCWNEEIPVSLEKFPTYSHFAFLTPEKAKDVLKLKSQSSPLYNGKEAIYIHLFGIERFLTRYFDISTPEDIPEEAFDFVKKYIGK